MLDSKSFKSDWNKLKRDSSFRRSNGLLIAVVILPSEFLTRSASLPAITIKIIKNIIANTEVDTNNARNFTVLNS